MNSTLENLVQSLEHSSKQVQETFGKLSEAQLNWKPAPDKWGVGECLEHIVQSNKQYFPEFDLIAKGGHKNSLWKKISPLSGLWGRMLLKSVSPDTQKKMKTASVFKPSRSSVPLSIISEFVKNNVELAGYIKKFEGVDLKKTKITSPVSGIITYSLADAIKILTTHERRHINQAKKVMETEGFPK